MAAAHVVRARLLGSFELSVDGVVIDRAAFERPSGVRLLKLLLATPGHRLRREAAAEALWPEADPERSAASLRKAIHFARRGLAAAGPGGPGADGPLVAAGDAVSLEPAFDLSVDADALSLAIDAVEAGITGVDDLEALVQLGTSELLPDDPYDEWLVPLRERLSQRTLGALARAAREARERGDRSMAARLVDALLAREPADESANRLAIELHLDAGELHAARRQLQRCRAAMAEAYGVEPDPSLERLVAEAAAARPSRLTATGPSEAPIVGRGRELAATESAFDEVAGGGSTAIVLRGPAGIGKSRVLRELGGLARASGWRTVDLRGLEASPGEPFGAIGAVLAAALGELGVTLPEPARSAVLTVAPATGERPSVEFASDAGMVAALADALGALAAEGPVGLMVDDAQWLDEGSLGVLEAALGDARPLVLAATIRDDPSLLGGAVATLLDRVRERHGQEIRLGPLGPREIQALIERDVDGDRVDDDLVDRITELAAGIPLFALELFRSSHDAGLVERRDGRWSRRRGVDSLPVPAGVSRLVEERVERLGGEAHRILAIAAELGDIVAFEDLVGTGLPVDATLDAVDRAIGAGIILETSGRYAFAHPLYRAALRTGLRLSDRADVHRRIALTLGGDLDPTDDEAIRRAGALGLDIAATATHAASAAELGRTEVAPLAVGFGIGAGERQARLFDHAGAVLTIRRALRIWQRLPLDAQRSFAISTAQVQLGEALRRSGDDAGAAAAFRSAIDAARGDDELAGAYAAGSWLSYEHGQYDAALRILDEGRARVRAPRPRAILDTGRAWILGRNGAWLEAEPILLAAVGVLEADGPSPELMRALDRLSIALADRDPAGSLAVLDRAMNLARQLGRTNELATFEMHLAGTLRELGRLDEAVAALDRARELCRQSGERYIESVTEWIAAEVQQTRGDDRAAIGHRRRELAIFGEIGGNPRHEALAHAHVAHLARRLGDRDVERFEADAARALARHSGMPDLEARVAWSLATDDWFAEQPVWGAPVADGVGNTAGTGAAEPVANG